MNAELEKGEIGIGNKETVKLSPLRIKILSYEIKMQQNKAKENVGEKVTFKCKHPEKEEPIEVSSVIYEKDGALKTSGSWFQLDSDGKIAKNSAVAKVLQILSVGNLKATVGKELDTKLDNKGYLCLKAY